MAQEGETQRTTSSIWSTTLTEAELLGILLGKGTRKKTAIDLARELLDQYESLQKLFSRSPSELMKIKGIGSAKAATLSAAFELVRGFNPRRILPRHLLDDLQMWQTTISL